MEIGLIQNAFDMRVNYNFSLLNILVFTKSRRSEIPDSHDFSLRVEVRTMIQLRALYPQRHYSPLILKKCYFGIA